jgi:2-dehydro-3-deoxyphosphooctonate aldolase (KDO 8-P synthase)
MPHPSRFTLGEVVLGGGPLFLIAGPCVLESESHARRMADAIQRIAADLKIPFLFKASYDKANRTSIHSFRGPGLVEGARILRSIAESNRLPILTDIHTAEQAAELSDRLGPVDAMLQIPAFLCRQTDLLIAAAHACAAPNRAVNVKKGQFVAPWDMRHAVEKVRESGSGANQVHVTLTERGASFGYNNLVVDMRSLPIMRALAPVVFDATHSVQTPSAANGVSGGQPEFIPVLARAAVAAGVDGIFLEVHDNPAEAKSDGANALHLNRLRPLLETLLALHSLVPAATVPAT